MNGERPLAPPNLELAVFTAESVVVFPLTPGADVRIGRGTDNDVVIDDASVSRRHARLHVGSTLVLEDLGSANGTQVREPRIEPEGDTVGLRRVAGQRVTVDVGDVIMVGAVAAVVRRAAIPEVPAFGRGAVVFDPATRTVFGEVAKVSPTMLSVLIIGETGAGKELVARAVHDGSPRGRGPFVAVNCAALAPTLVESELFGHERGAFTGAQGAKEGLLESANHGTFFLDEVGELPLDVQAKLLRVLEDRNVTRVGARTARPIDVRFVSATNRDLERAMGEGTFRSDLYFRLSGLTLELPPLRRRPADLEPLVTHFLAESSAALSRHPRPNVAPETLRVLETYPFPGNVRELRNLVERALVLCDGPTILPEHLPPRVRASAGMPGGSAVPTTDSPLSTGAPDAVVLERRLQDLERKRVLDVLERCAGNQTRAAELLGMSRRTLVNRLNQYGVARPRKPS